MWILICGLQLSASAVDTLTTPITIAIDTTICSGGDYEGYFQEGTHIDTFLTDSGCDSIRTLNLGFHEPIRINRDTCIIEGNPIPGIFETVFIDENGCDAILTYIVTVIPAAVVTNVSLCEGESFVLPDGTVIDSSGQYTIVASGDCMSAEILNVTFLPYVEATQDTICANSDFEAGTYNLPGVGCGGDLMLLVLPVPDNILIREEICEGDTVVVNGIPYSEAGTFGTALTADNGCTYIETIDINVIPLSECLDAVDQLDKNIKMVVYPNPVSTILSIDLDSKGEALKDVTIYNEQGQIIKSLKATGLHINVEDLSAGLYYLEVNLGDSYRPMVKFIKQ